MRILAVVVLVLPMLFGCVTNPPARESSMQEPMSQQVAVGDSRKRAKAHVDLGMEYLVNGNLAVALDEARSAIAADSSYSLGYNLLALVQMYLSENRGAEENFQRALGLTPGDPEISNNYGWFLCQTERESQSIAYFVAASSVALYATPTKPLTNAGICSLAMKDDKGAEDFLRRALRADPTNADAQFLVADICYRGGRLEEARARLDEVHKRREVSAQSAWLGLRIARKLGDREIENRYAAEIRRRFQNSAEYRSMAQGQFE
jgi:type IV pilus assembly protein PilF